MPRIPSRDGDEHEIVLTEYDAREAAWSEFVDPSEWKRSKKGNLWRHYEGLTVTVFCRADGLYGWSVADSDDVRYSRRVCESEDAAMDALGEELGVIA